MTTTLRQILMNAAGLLDDQPILARGVFEKYIGT
jgi:hypothetical protein